VRALLGAVIGALVISTLNVAATANAARFEVRCKPVLVAECEPNALAAHFKGGTPNRCRIS
jgi:hypothetical protein